MATKATTSRSTALSVAVGLFLAGSWLSAQTGRKYTTSAQAMSAAQQLLGTIADGSSEATRLDSSSGDLSLRISTLRAEIQELTDEEQATIADLRNGMYCSQCNKSATEIRKGGEDFNAHLRRVGGTPIPAPGQLVLIKQGEYAKRIEDKQKALKDLEAQQSALFDARQRLPPVMNQALRGYYEAIDAASNLLASEMKTEAGRLQAEIEQSKKKLLASQDPTLTSLLKTLLAQKSAQVIRLDDKYRMDFAALEQQKSGDLMKLAQYYRDANGSFMIPPTAGLARTLGLFGTSVGQTQAEMKLGIGLVSPVVSVNEDFFKNTQSVKVGLEMMGGAVTVGMERQTKWTPDGVKTSDAPYLTLNPALTAMKLPDVQFSVTPGVKLLPTDAPTGGLNSKPANGPGPSTDDYHWFAAGAKVPTSCRPYFFEPGTLGSSAAAKQSCDKENSPGACSEHRGPAAPACY